MVCGYCGDVMLGDNRTNRRFCSRTCAGKAKMARDRSVPIDQTCATCGAHLSRFHQTHKMKYCDRRCWSVAIRGNFVVRERNDCRVCGNPLNTGAMYCSISCANAHRSKDVLIERDLQICDLYEQKLSYRKIGDRFAISGERVRQIIVRLRPNLIRGKAPKPPRQKVARSCVFCGAEYSGRRLKYCSDDCYKKSLNKYRTQYIMRRYHSDPEFRAKKLQKMKEWQRDHYATDSVYHQKVNDRTNNRNRKRYHTDPEYRAKQLDKQRHRYATDPEYRERQKALARERWNNNIEYRERKRELKRSEEYRARERERKKSPEYRARKNARARERRAQLRQNNIIRE